MRTSIAGKVENTPLPVSRPLAPLYEALHNALQAIEDAGPGKHEIDITVERLADFLDVNVARPTGFVITDSGVGFTDDNARSFFTAESRHKADRGGKGNGRFLWLKAFESVEIDSHFAAPDRALRRRVFVFDKREDQSAPDPVAATSRKRGSEVKLIGLNERVSKQLSRTLEWYADQIIAHFLPFFRRPECPVITIRDGGKPVSLNERFASTVAPNAMPRPFKVDDDSFTLTGYRVTSAEARHNVLVFAARGRAVKRERLGTYVAGLERKLDNQDGSTAAYLGFVEGERLDFMVRSDRLGFEIDEDEDDLFEGSKSLSSIRDGALEVAREDLSAELGKIRERKEEAVHQYVAEQAPEYRRLVKTQKDRVPGSAAGQSKEARDRSGFGACAFRAASGPERGRQGAPRL